MTKETMYRNIFSSINLCEFELFLLGSPKVIFPASYITALPGFGISCLVSGTPPIYTALIRNATLLINTTETASIERLQEGNYTCKAINEFGTDSSTFSVIINGKVLSMFFGFKKLIPSNLIFIKVPCNQNEVKFVNADGLGGEKKKQEKCKMPYQTTNKSF